MLHVVSFEELYEAIDQYNALGLNPHGPSEPIPGVTQLTLEIEFNHPSLAKLELPYNTLPTTGDQPIQGFITDYNYLPISTKAFVRRHWHRTYLYSPHLRQVTDVRLLVAKHQEPEYFAAGYKSAHEWLSACRAVRRPLVIDDGFLLRLPLPTDAPIDIPLKVELVPEPAWWSNLRSNLTPTNWQKLRRIVVAAANQECEICRFKNNHRSPDVHEQWSYDEERGVQKLERMIALCTYCHASVHHGRSTATGNQEIVEEHLMKINGWSRKTLEEYLDERYAEWRRRNEIDWKLDISYIEQLGVAVPERLDRMRA